jgi:serine/threonine protein kinase
MAMPTPEQIRHYRILDKLGEGGMGIVYVAEDQRLGRRVAIKLLRADSGDPNAGSRLIREARLAAGISHPLICQVFELGEFQGQPFIVMELLTGEPLAARLTAPLQPSEALKIAASVMEALCVLHDHGIVHRDLKPSNIFVTITRGIGSGPLSGDPPGSDGLYERSPYVLHAGPIQSCSRRRASQQ